MLGCISEKKARKIADEYYKNSPGEFAQKCADTFPINSQYIEGITVVRKDTVIQKGILLDCPEQQKQVRCPDSKTIYIKTVRVDTVVKENTAKLASLESKVLAVTNELSVTRSLKETNEKQSKNRLYIIIALCTLLGISIFQKIKGLV